MQSTIKDTVMSNDTEENLENLMARVERLEKKFNITRLEALQLLGLHVATSKEQTARRADVSKFIEAVLSNVLGLWREFMKRRDGKL